MALGEFLRRVEAWQQGGQAAAATGERELLAAEARRFQQRLERLRALDPEAAAGVELGPAVTLLLQGELTAA